MNLTKLIAVTLLFIAQPTLAGPVNNDDRVMAFCYALQATKVCDNLSMRFDTESKLVAEVGAPIQGPKSPYLRACQRGLLRAKDDEQKGLCEKAWSAYGCLGRQLPRLIQEDPLRNRRAQLCVYR